MLWSASRISLPDISMSAACSGAVTFHQGGKKHTVRGYRARAGYNLATGVGTIDAQLFVPELARAAR